MVLVQGLRFRLKWRRWQKIKRMDLGQVQRLPRNSRTIVSHDFLSQSPKRPGAGYEFGTAARYFLPRAHHRARMELYDDTPSVCAHRSACHFDLKKCNDHHRDVQPRVLPPLRYFCRWFRRFSQGEFVNPNFRLPRSANSRSTARSPRLPHIVRKRGARPCAESFRMALR